MSIDVAIDTALFNKLIGSAGASLWGNRVFTEQAPLNTPLPYVVITFVSGGRLNVSPSQLFDGVYQIDVWAEEQAQARLGADYIDAEFNSATLVISGWTNNFGTTVVGMTRSTEQKEGKQRCRRGREVRVRASK